MSFHTVIEKYRSSATSSQELGARFERLMQAFLRTYQPYDGKFKEVWLWSEFPYRDKVGSGQDIGIDLVCKTSENEYWAVQCKCFSADTAISKDDVDSFLSASGKRFRAGTSEPVSFSHRLWVSTTNKWSSNAEASLQNQVPEVLRLNLNDLEAARVDWDKLDEGISGAAARLEKFELRAYQKEALNKVHTHFQEHDRGKLIMACGTGKTLLSLKIAENETANNGLILFLAPSIALVGQT
ncbi:MAG: DEAD/DEAH box helicase family protein, partial [Lachnospiraceae bacterium]|nr:DEAD/DEAH box helicase family protein [Lachnospiraceae bacterium]